MSQKISNGLTVYFGFPCDSVTYQPPDTDAKWAEKLEQKRRARRAWVRELSNELFPSLEYQDYRYNKNGKPFYPNGPDFSISHCDTVTTAVFSEYHNVGIDLQDFSARHTRSFNSYFRTDLTSDEAAKVWVRMETISKFLGRGLSCGLNRLYSLATATKAGSDYDNSAAGTYSIHGFEINKLHGAVCVAGHHDPCPLNVVHWKKVPSHG